MTTTNIKKYKEKNGCYPNQRLLYCGKEHCSRKKERDNLEEAMQQLSSSAFRVYCLLKTYCDDKGYRFAFSSEIVATKTSQSSKSVQRAWHELEDAGYITKGDYDDYVFHSYLAPQTASTEVEVEVEAEPIKPQNHTNTNKVSKKVERLVQYGNGAWVSTPFAAYWQTFYPMETEDIVYAHWCNDTRAVS